MTSVTIIQARTNSQRLPGKVLLPINSIPIVVLTAKRASNTGRSVIVATSIEESDDGLVKVLEDYQIDYFRGSLEDTLSRIVAALSGYSDDTVVTRLTADNVFPDGVLLDEIELHFNKKNYKYIVCNGPESGVPYGVSAEVTKLKYLRAANKYSKCEFEREHVTPYIIGKYGKKFYKKYESLKMGKYRVTIDDIDDYYFVSNLFSNISEPCHASFLDLIGKINSAKVNFCSYRKHIKKFVIGTAQFGFDYGINNASGKPEKYDVEMMLKIAISNGIESIDTAMAYGESEEIIGKTLNESWIKKIQITTKLDPLDDLDSDTSKLILEDRINTSIKESISKLGLNSIENFLFHRSEHIDNWDGAALDIVKKFQANGVIRDIGVSVQSPDQLIDSIRNKNITIIQMPFNILDWRWNEAINAIIQEKKKRKIIIHARSPLLQGLFVSNDKKKWYLANEKNPIIYIDWLDDMAKKFKRMDKIDLCLSYLRSFSWIDGIVLGIESIEQLKKNMIYFGAPLLEKNVLKIIEDKRPKLASDSLDPSQWRIE